MSRATNQTLILLSMVAGAFKVMLGEGLLDETTQHTAAYGQDVCERIIYDYPATGDERKNAEWMHVQLRHWSRLIDETHKRWTPLVLSTLALNIVEDLMQVIGRKAVLERLDVLRGALIALSSPLIDQVGDEFASFEDADRCLGEMYRLIEFSRG